MKIQISGTYVMNIIDSACAEIGNNALLDEIIRGETKPEEVVKSCRIGRWILRFEGLLKSNHRPLEDEMITFHSPLAAFRATSVSTVLSANKSARASMALEREDIFTGGFERGKDTYLLLRQSVEYIETEILPRLSWFGLTFKEIGFAAEPGTEFLLSEGDPYELFAPKLIWNYEMPESLRKALESEADLASKREKSEG